MGKKKKALTKPRPEPHPSPKPACPASAEVLDRIGELERRMLAGLAEQRRATERGRVGMVAFSRTVNTLLLPLRAGLWVAKSVFHPRSSAKILRDWLYIRKSGLFDARFYLRVYPDVMASAIDPVMHYCMSGWREMRNPRPDFITAAYLERNLDVKFSGVNPFYHYVRYRGCEHHREGTARPLASGADARCQQTVSLSVPFEIRKVPAPLTGDTLTNEMIARIAATVKKGLYENA